jgi:co-chaperonin GroES (HSP10)
VGDVVLYNIASAVPVVLNKEPFLVIKEEAILAVVDPD